VSSHALTERPSVNAAKSIRLSPLQKKQKKQKSRKAEKQKSRKAEKQKSRKAEKQKSRKAEKQIPYGLKPIRNDKNKRGLYVAPKGATLQNNSEIDFFSSLFGR
jgi:hypothetical protein